MIDELKEGNNEICDGCGAISEIIFISNSGIAVCHSCVDGAIDLRF